MVIFILHFHPTYRTPHHGVSFAGASLSVREHARVVAFVRRLQNIMTKVLKNLQQRITIVTKQLAATTAAFGLFPLLRVRMESPISSPR